MKEILNWQSKEVVNIYDEVNLWSAPFGRMLLENIPMRKGITIVDLGFGTGFPLVELSQRFGESSKIYGVDIWEEAINRTKAKIKALGLNNIEIMEASATSINLPDQQTDLVTSNLGINNFEDKEKVYAEVHRILKPDGRLCLTTNPIGTFEELFDLFEIILKEMNLNDKLKELNAYLQHRNSQTTIEAAFIKSGFELVQSKSDFTNMRFSDADALLNHSLIRIGFRQSWESLIGEELCSIFFKNLTKKLNAIIEKNGSFKMTIPMLYLEFKKPN